MTLKVSRVKKYFGGIKALDDCSLEIERDYNSALEIKRLCLQQIGQELSKFKPVKIALTGNSMDSSHQLMKQEAFSRLV